MLVNLELGDKRLFALPAPPAGFFESSMMPVGNGHASALRGIASPERIPPPGYL
jgi:hypothetical protein